MTEKSSHWMCLPGEYADYVATAARLDPALDLPDHKNRRTPFCSRQAQVTTLSITSEGGRASFTRHDFKNASELETYFDARSDMIAPSGRVFIMEGLSREFIDLLGWRLKIPPRFFLTQERVQIWSHSDHHKRGLAPLLPSTLSSSSSFHLNYFELRYFNDHLSDFQLACAFTGRHVGAHRIFGEIEPVGILRRRWSYWSDQNRRGQCWNVVILCDPPLTHLRLGSGDHTTRVIPVRSEPFQGGYTDFLIHNDLSKPPSPPRRESMLEDFCYYFERLWANVDHSMGLELPQIIIQKLVASHYMQFVDYLKSTVGQLEFFLSRRDDLDIFTQHWAELQWSNLQGINRRLSEYLVDVNDIISSCRRFQIPLYASLDEWKNGTQDFSVIEDDLKAVKKRVEQLLNSITALTSIVGNKQAIRESKRSLREAKSVKTLTVLGVVFAPLALCCGLFSMSDSYLPGASHFWIYFAVGIPLIILVVALFYVIDMGYGEDGEWSLTRLLTTSGFKETVKKNIPK